MERSTIWSLSSPGGRLFDDRRIPSNTRSEGVCVAASPSPAAAPTPPNVIEPVAPYLTLPSNDDPDGVLYDYAAIASPPPPRIAIVQALMRERQRDVLRAAEMERINQDRLYDLTALYPLWTADDTSSCDDCPVRSYSDLAWRDQGDEREVL